MQRSFEEMVAEAEAAPVKGWDSGWLDGRATEQRPSWGYARLMAARMATATAAAALRGQRYLHKDETSGGTGSRGAQGPDSAPASSPELIRTRARG
jgi:hypothetical protein